MPESKYILRLDYPPISIAVVQVKFATLFYHFSYQKSINLSEIKKLKKNLLAVNAIRGTSFTSHTLASQLGDMVGGCGIDLLESSSGSVLESFMYLISLPTDKASRTKFGLTWNE